MVYFTLYSRSYCHLCDDMRIALENLVNDIPHQLIVIDVDQDPQLVDLFDELVPVLFASKTKSEVGKKLCHHFLEPSPVKAFCHEQ